MAIRLRTTTYGPMIAPQAQRSRGYAPDQSYRNKGAVMANFFAIPAATQYRDLASSADIRRGGAELFSRAIAGNAGYRVHIGPELEDYPSDSAMHRRESRQCAAAGADPQSARTVPLDASAFKGLIADYPDYYGRSSRDPRAAGFKSRKPCRRNLSTAEAIAGSRPPAGLRTA